MWLSVEGDMLSSSAAARKLPCRAIAAKAKSAVRLGCCFMAKHQ